MEGLEICNEYRNIFLSKFVFVSSSTAIKSANHKMKTVESVVHNKRNKKINSLVIFFKLIFSNFYFIVDVKKKWKRES